MEQELRPGKWTEHTPSKRAIEGFAARSFQKHDVNGYFADNLLCSVPGSFLHGPFDLNFGCLLSARIFVHLIIEYDEKDQLTRWVERRYQPTMQG